MTDRQMTITITSGTLLRAILFLVGAWALFYLRETALIVFTAIVIASAIEPGVVALMRRKFPRVFAVLVIYLVFFAAFFTVFYFVLPSILEDAAGFLSALPDYIAAFGSSGAFDSYSQILGLPSPSELTASDIMSAVRTGLDPGGAFSNALSAVSTIFGGVVSFILIVVFSFYFAMAETGVEDFLRIVTPKPQQHYVLGLWRRAQQKIGLWMQGQLLLAVLMGVIVYILLIIFHIPHALVLGLVAALFEIIPVFGPTLAAVPAVAVAFATGGISLGFVVVAIYVIAQQFENHLIYPLVVTRVVGVPPLLVILALICGAKLAGFLGIILSVPIAATIQELARDIESGRFMREEAKAQHE
jgi:predicted PurR-regulated permease PerM